MKQFSSLFHNTDAFNDEYLTYLDGKSFAAGLLRVSLSIVFLEAWPNLVMGEKSDCVFSLFSTFSLGFYDIKIAFIPQTP